MAMKGSMGRFQNAGGLTSGKKTSMMTVKKVAGGKVDSGKKK